MGSQLVRMLPFPVLARAGKRVLRPGGIELTRQMLDALAISPRDSVVEFAPGLGITAGMVLKRRPVAYWGVEREPAAAECLRGRLARTKAEIVLGLAEQSGLPGACATVVYGEARGGSGINPKAIAIAVLRGNSSTMSA